MIKPAVLVVDDDPEVLRAVGRDLRREYGSRYRVLQAESADAGLDVLRQLKQRNEHLALFLVDQRMPRMTGVEFLEKAIGLFPEAKRALLTAYADTQAAIDAINRAHINHYLQKPWDPPEEKLYPILTELLDDWEAGFRPPFEGLRLVGHRWSPQAHHLKEFLARNHVPYLWLDLASNPEASRALEEKALTDAGLPVVLLQDGTHIERASLTEVAERVGLRTRGEQDFYPFVIVGAGPAGLAAAVYAASEGVSTLLIEEEAPGGQAGQSSRIENYLGFPGGVSGGELARRAAQQARKFGAEILTPQRVASVRIEGQFRHVVLGDGREISCHALLIATGVSYRRLERPGIEALTGAGIYYGAAATEAREAKGEDVYVLGGANSAGQAAIHLAQYARKVCLLVRGASLASMSQYLIDQIGQTSNIEMRTSTAIVEALGESHLERLELRNTETGTTETVPASGLFILIGAEPRTQWLESVVARDAHGFIKTGPSLSESGSRPKFWPLDRDPYLLEASVPGIFAAGDVRAGSLKRVAAGVGEGSMVVSFVHQYLARL
ncbi:MAG: FAD-dependent oxidoreductase [Longimicrobiales bacterium]